MNKNVQQIRINCNYARNCVATSPSEYKICNVNFWLWIPFSNQCVLIFHRQKFWETGVERIVDQAVNPKINSIFVPKIEDLSYKILNIEKPKERRMRAIKVDTNQLGFLPALDLEQVSPDSSSKSPTEELNAVKVEEAICADQTVEEYESPAFELHESAKATETKEEENVSVDMDIVHSNDTDYEQKSQPAQHSEQRDSFHHELDGKSNLSSISGLTSNGSMNDVEEAIVIKVDKNEQMAEIETETISEDVTMEDVSIQPDAALVAEARKENDATATVPMAVDVDVTHESNGVYRPDANHDSALSRISNNSPLSMHTTQSEIAEDENAHNADSLGLNSSDGVRVEKSIRSISLCEIDDEAQMQKFNESSSSNNSSHAEKDSGTSDNNATDERCEVEPVKPVTNFDIKKEEIKFEGPERKAFGDFSITKFVPENDPEIKTPNEILSPAFEPSSFTVKPIEVSCADLNVDDVRTSISDCFETNSSQSNSNNLIIIENDDLNAKSMDASVSASVSPRTNESTMVTPPNDEKRSSREKSAEHKASTTSSSSRHKSDNKHSSSSRGSSSNHGKDRSTSSKEPRSSSSRDKHHKSSTSSSSRRRSRSRDKDKDKDRSKNSVSLIMSDLFSYSTPCISIHIIILKISKKQPLFRQSLRKYDWKKIYEQIRFKVNCTYI